MPEAGRRLDPRQARTRARVYAAALDVLRRLGIGATTFDTIAQQAGVARSTLYRNWASRDELLYEAIEEQAPFPATSPGDPASARLESALAEIAMALSTTSWGSILPAALAATDASPALAEGYQRFMAGLRATFTTIIADGKKTGELPASLNDEEFIDALIIVCLKPGRDRQKMRLASAFEQGHRHVDHAEGQGRVSISAERPQVLWWCIDLHETRARFRVRRDELVPLQS